MEHRELNVEDQLFDLEPENRRSAYRVSRPLDIRYVRPGGTIQSGRAINISQTGARIMVEAGGECPELTVEFEGKIALLARTVWRQKLPGGKQVVGVVFEGFHWSQRVALDDYILDVERRAA